MEDPITHIRVNGARSMPKGIVTHRGKVLGSISSISSGSSMVIHA